MDINKKELLRFLQDIKRSNYSYAFASLHATNLIMQEGQLEYDIQPDDELGSMVLHFIFELGAFSLDLDPNIVDDLINELEKDKNIERIKVVFVLNKKEIVRLYNLYKSGKFNL